MKKKYIKFTLYIGGIILSFLPSVTLAVENISISNLVNMPGISSGDNLGTAIATGDVNGDGFSDLLIGSDDSENNYRGKATLVYGDGTSFEAADLAAGVVFSSSVDFDFSTAEDGVAIADFNNDGYDDIAIGAFGAGTGGEVYIIYGKATKLVASDLTNFITFTAESSGDILGYYLETADLDKDGYSDLLMSGYGDDDAGTNAGAYYILYGQAAEWSSASVSTFIKITGANANDRLGINLHAEGDFNNDGNLDILAGAPTHSSNLGAIFILYGDGGRFTSQSIGTSGVQYTGTATSERFGDYRLSSGDFNNDGYDEIVATSWANGAAMGKVFIIPGQKSKLSGGLNTSTEIITLTGSADNDEFGRKSDGRNDINNDGYDDLVIGANGYNQKTGGSVFVYYGGASGITDGGGPLTADLQIDGITADANFGISVLVEDINGDIFPEIIIGENNYDSGTFAAPEGSIYIAYLYVDNDGDGVTGTEGYYDGTDCDDTDAAISTNQTYYADNDGDGFGVFSETISVCSTTAPEGYVTNSTDKNDTDADNDGYETDIDCDDTDATIFINYYQDLDQDSFGNSEVVICSGATAPEGYVTDNSDTDDTPVVDTPIEKILSTYPKKTWYRVNHPTDGRKIVLRKNGKKLKVLNTKNNTVVKTKIINKKSQLRTKYKRFKKGGVKYLVVATLKKKKGKLKIQLYRLSSNGLKKTSTKTVKVWKGKKLRLNYKTKGKKVIVNSPKNRIKKYRVTKKKRLKRVQ